MAKYTEKKALMRGKANGTVIGELIAPNDFTFSENSYPSGWTDRSANIGIDCGNGNIIYLTMRSGYFPDKENVIRAFDKNEKDDKGKMKQFEIPWEDRLSDEWGDTVADFCFITIGIEKDVKGKTLYKKFLTAYDAVEYLQEHYEAGIPVNVKYNIKYNEYEGNTSCQKEITSIALSSAQPEDYKATFSQTILIDSDSVGKPDPEKGTISLDAYVVDYVGKPKINGEKIAIQKNVAFPKTFEVEVNKDNKDITARMLKKYFSPKKGKITELTVVGKLVEGTSIVNITEDDIPDDIKELIELGIYSQDEISGKVAIGNASREKRMIITKPDIIFVGNDEERKPTVAVDDSKYVVDDLLFYEEAVTEAGGSLEVKETKDDDIVLDDSDDDLMSLLADM